MKLSTLDIMFYTPLIVLLWTFVILSIVKIIKELMSKQFKSKEDLLKDIEKLDIKICDKQYQINFLKNKLKEKGVSINEF